MLRPTETFGQWLRETRLSKKLSVTECAHKAGWSLPTWSNWENDRSRRKDNKPTEPRSDTARAIARALDVPVEDVLEAARVSPVAIDPNTPFLREIETLLRRAPAEMQGPIKDVIRQHTESLVLLTSEAGHYCTCDSR